MRLKVTRNQTLKDPIHKPGKRELNGKNTTYYFVVLVVKECGQYFIGYIKT